MVRDGHNRDEEALPKRRTNDLRLGRVSAPGCTYFVTAVTKDRDPVFRNEFAARKAMAAWETLHAAGDWELLAATLMPDHVHLLFVLGGRLELNRAIAKFKVLGRGGNSASWRWQDNVFEHRLRHRESSERYALYIFMNPYVAGVAGRAECWPWWASPNPARFRFLAGRNPNGGPADAWFSDNTDEQEPLVTGE